MMSKLVYKVYSLANHKNKVEVILLEITYYFPFLKSLNEASNIRVIATLEAVGHRAELKSIIHWLGWLAKNPKL